MVIGLWRNRIGCFVYTIFFPLLLLFSIILGVVGGVWLNIIQWGVEELFVKRKSNKIDLFWRKWCHPLLVILFSFLL